MSKAHSFEFNEKLKNDILCYVNNGINSEIESSSTNELFNRRYKRTTFLLIIIWLLEGMIFYGCSFIML